MPQLPAGSLFPQYPLLLWLLRPPTLNQATLSPKLQPLPTYLGRRAGKAPSRKVAVLACLPAVAGFPLGTSPLAVACAGLSSRGPGLVMGGEGWRETEQERAGEWGTHALVYKTVVGTHQTPDQVVRN